MGAISLLLGLIVLVINVVRRKRALTVLQQGVEANAEVITSEAHYFNGDSWYRTYVTIDDDLASPRLLLGCSRFEPGQQISVVCSRREVGPVIEASTSEDWRLERGLWGLGPLWWPTLILSVVGLLLMLFPAGDSLGW